MKTVSKISSVSFLSVALLLLSLLVVNHLTAWGYEESDAGSESNSEQAVNEFIGPVLLSAETQLDERSLTPTPGWELFGTCEWRIDDAGCLTIRPANGGAEGAFPILRSDDQQSMFPWNQEADVLSVIRSVKLEGVISASNSLRSMFEGFENLSSIEGLNNLKTSSVEYMGFMFRDCSSLTSLDLSSFDTSSAINMEWMFSGCSSLRSLDLSSFDTSNVTDMNTMFYYCSSLTSLDLSSFNTSNVTDMHFMFDYCSSLTSLDLSSFDTSSVINMHAMFASCLSLTSLDLSSFDTSSVINMQGMFWACCSFTSSDISSFLSSFDTSSVENMSYMFHACYPITSLDLSNFDTSSVINMEFMFDGCRSLTSLDLSNFDTSNVTNMEYMFNECSSLISLNLSSFDTSSVANMNDMFRKCSSLTSLDLSSFDTSSVISMQGMFRNCTSLTSLDLSSFNISSVPYIHMDFMFDDCTSLTSLDLSSFDTSNVEIFYTIFSNCHALSEITVGEKFTLQKEFPQRLWTNTKGDQFYPDSIPIGVADTYTSMVSYVSINVPEDGSTVLNVGEVLYLSVDASPSSLTDSLAWFSSDESVASVDGSGKVSANAEGTATITVSAAGLSDSITITVRSSGGPVVEVESVELDRTQMALVGQDAQTLTASVQPADATYKNIVWSSSDENVARVNAQGSVTAVGKGSATITARSADGKRSATCLVTVSNPVTWIGFGLFPSGVYIGKDHDIKISMRGDLPGETDEPTSVAWSSSNSSIAEVSGSGMEATIRGIAIGSCAVQVKAVCNGKTFDLTEQVDVIWDLVESIILSETSKAVEVGSESFTLEYGISNPSAAGRLEEIKWSSSSLADIEGSNGTLTIIPKRAGNETIRFWCEGQSAESLFSLTITPKTVTTSEDSDIEGYMNINDVEALALIGNNRLRIMDSEDKENSDLIRLAVGSAGGVSTMLDAYEVDLVDDAGNVVPWNQPNHALTIFLKMNDSIKAVLDGHDVRVHYIDTESNEAEAKNTWIEGDNIVFETTHFSTYAITATQKADDTLNGGNSGSSGALQNGTKVGGDPSANKLAQTGDMLGFGVFAIIELMMVAVGFALIARSRTLKFRRK